MLLLLTSVHIYLILISQAHWIQLQQETLQQTNLKV